MLSKSDVSTTAPLLFSVAIRSRSFVLDGFAALLVHHLAIPNCLLERRLTDFFLLVEACPASLVSTRSLPAIIHTAPSEVVAVALIRMICHVLAGAKPHRTGFRWIRYA